MVRARMIYYLLVGESTLGIKRDQAERLVEERCACNIPFSRSAPNKNFDHHHCLPVYAPQTETQILRLMVQTSGRL
jgi:hypothetical protein